jgi:hypothetical protein
MFVATLGYSRRAYTQPFPVSNRYLGHAETDLQLKSRRRLKAKRFPRLGEQVLAPARPARSTVRRLTEIAFSRARRWQPHRHCPDVAEAAQPAKPGARPRFSGVGAGG